MDIASYTRLEEQLIGTFEKKREEADKELDKEQVIASLYDPAAEAAAREAEAEGTAVEAADVPADNGSKPETSEEA